MDWGSARVRCLREARRVLRNPADIEEATQEALLRAWRHRERIQASGKWLSWVAVIARNEALRLVHRRNKLSLAETEADEIELGCTDLALEQTLDALAIEGLLAPLQAGEQALLRLRYVEDLTQGQIASQLGMPEGTVKVRLHRLRQRLREAAGDEFR